MARDRDIRVLITGAAGFGGSGLARALLARGYTVTGLDIVPPSHANLLRRELSDPAFDYLWKSIQDIQPRGCGGPLGGGTHGGTAGCPTRFRVAPIYGHAEHRRARSPCLKRCAKRTACRS